MVMRVVSNYASIGMNASSHRVKQVNRRGSRGAYEMLVQSSDFEQWSRSTINEHEFPLAVIWSKTPGLRPEALWKVFVDHPMTTVTREEDLSLPKSGDRYAGLEILWLEKTPKEIYEQLKSGQL